MKNVVILGGGFAGLRAALVLKNKVKSHNLHITLIDKHSFHVFTPSLYEVATAEEPQLNVVIPYGVIFNKNIEVVRGNVGNIDISKKTIFIDSADGKERGQEFEYDYLIYALGSHTQDFGIPGIREYGVGLKTLEDAVKIKNALSEIIMTGKNKVVVGGGGFSGTELACEIAAHQPRLDVTMIQGSPILLKELGDGFSELAKKRLEEGNVRVILGVHIKKVNSKTVVIDGDKEVPYDLLVWTGGVGSDKLLGDIEVNNFLQVKGHENIFAAGDTISPGVAPRAEKMGRVAAENVLKSIKGNNLLPYSYRHLGYIVPLGSHFAALAMGKFHISGVLAFFVQQIVFFLYLLRIVPPLEALKRFRKFEKTLNEDWLS